MLCGPCLRCCGCITFDRSASRSLQLLGIWARCCGCCCSIKPLIEEFTKGLERPAQAFLSTEVVDGTIIYKHVSKDELEASMLKKPEFVAMDRGREIDGSGQNPNHPFLGGGNQPFAISVPKSQQKTDLSKVDLPDPKAVFDELFLRKTFTPCPTGANALLMYTGLIATHEFFRTDEGRGEDRSTELVWIQRGGSSYEEDNEERDVTR
jgi:hypothetical protein